MGGILHTAAVGAPIKYFHKADDKKMESTIVKSIDYNAYFGDNHVVKNVNIEIPRNNVVAVMGPSGCGKSTLLRILIDLIKPSSGNVKISAEERLAMVFQNFALFPWLTVNENIGFGMKMAGRSPCRRSSAISR